MAFRIEHRIGVAAPAAEVWELVYDLAGWKDWTELYTEAAGRIAIGETLRFTFQVDGRAPQALTGVVYDWVPEAQMAWRVKLLGNVLTSLRYIEIETLSETSCILANGDYYFGLTGLIPRNLRAQVRAGFQRMNENAKRIAEERFVAKGGAVSAAAPEPAMADDVVIQPLVRPTLPDSRPWGFGKKSGLLGPALNK